LSLNFFTKPAACPTKYAGKGMAMEGCECCYMHRHISGPDGKMPGKSPEMCCHCGMCHITSGTAVPSGADGVATVYLQLRTVSFLPRFSPRHFMENRTDPVFFLLGREKDRPPETS